MGSTALLKPNSLFNITLIQNYSSRYKRRRMSCEIICVQSCKLKTYCFYYLLLFYDYLTIIYYDYFYYVGHGGALVETTPFDRRVVGSNHALPAICRDLGQVLHLQLQLPVALRCVGLNSDIVSIAVVGSASERFML